MKPIIGIVGRPLRDEKDRISNCFLDASRRAIITNGGVPIGIMPPQDINYIDTKTGEIEPLTDNEKELLIKQIELCDGILFQGGNRWFLYDEFVCKQSIEMNKPCLCICMSMQLLGKLDMIKHNNMSELVRVEGHSSNEDYVHDVNISKESILYNILGKERIRVNSRHNYTVPEVYDLKVGARSDDGVIEAIERTDKDFVLGLQWHPEFMYQTDEDQNKIIKYFIDKCKH